MTVSFGLQFWGVLRPATSAPRGLAGVLNLAASRALRPMPSVEAIEMRTPAGLKPRAD
jgi:hypothetical protein